MSVDRIAFVALWAFVFVVPWELFYQFPGFGTMGRLVGVAALGMGVLAVALRGAPRRPLVAHMLMIAFMLWSGLTLWWTVDPEATHTRLWTYVQLGVMVLLIWELSPSLQRQMSLLQAYVFGAYVSALGTILNYLSGTTVAAGRFAASGFNPNELGFTLVLAMPMAWHLALTGRRAALVWLNRLYIPIGMAAVLLTASRGAFIPAIVALLIIPWTLGRYQLRTKLGIALLLVASLMFLNSFVPETTWERLGRTTEEIEEGSFSHRGEIWKAGFHVFLRHPVRGVGAGGFNAAVEPILGDDRSPHQTFLSILVGQGAIGLALFLAMAASLLLAVRRLPELYRKFWIIVALTLLVGLQARTWDYRKQLWVVFGVLACQAALVRRRSPAAESVAGIVGPAGVVVPGAPMPHPRLTRQPDMVGRSARLRGVRP